MLIGGVVCLVIGAILVAVHVWARRRAAHLARARETTADELVSVGKMLAKELGDGGGLSEFATLRGRIECPSPLRSPLGERPCVHYRMSVTRKYEEQYEERDKQGNVRRGTRTGSEVVNSSSQSCDFDLVDEQGGRVTVRAPGVDMDGTRSTVDRFQPDTGFGGSLSFGGFSMSLPTGMGMGGLGVSGRRTLGYQFDEDVMPLGEQVTVVAQVGDRGGRLEARSGGACFIVSTRTRKELIGSANKTASWTAAGSGLLCLIGLGLTVAGLIAG